MKQYIDKTEALERLYKALAKYPNPYILGLEMAIKIITDMPLEIWCENGQERIS